MMDAAAIAPATDAAVAPAADGAAPVDPAIAGQFAALLALLAPVVPPAAPAAPSVGGSVELAGQTNQADQLAGVPLAPLDAAASSAAFVPTVSSVAAAPTGASATSAEPDAGRAASLGPPGVPMPRDAAPAPSAPAGLDLPAEVAAGGGAAAGAAPSVSALAATVPAPAAPLALAAVAAATPGAPVGAAGAAPAPDAVASATAAPATAPGPTPGERRAAHAGEREPGREDGARREAATETVTPAGVSVGGQERAETVERPGASAPGADPARFAQLVDGLAARLRVLQQGDGGSVRMQLAPRELGEVVVRLEIRDGVAQANLIAETPDAGRMLGAAAAELRTALAERGLQIDRIEVRVSGDAGPRADGGSHGEQERSSSRGPRTPAAPTSLAAPSTPVGSSIPESGVSLLA